MALLLKSNNATGTPAAQSVNPSADTTAEDYNHTHPTPSKPTRSAPYSTSGGGGAMEDPYGMAANIPLEEREVVFAPPSSAADLYRFFPAPAKKTELQSQTVDSFLTPRRSPEQRNSVGDDLSADESMPIDVKRNDDIENNDDDDDDVASWLDNNEKDGQVDENVENNNKNEEEEELIMEPGDNEIEDNPKLLDEKQPFSLGDLNHLKKTYNAAEKGEQKEVGEKFPVADEKSPESEPAKEKLFPSFISNADVAENDCIGDNNPTNSKSVITNSVVDPVDRPISTLTGAPFKMHRIRQQTTYRDEARKRFRSALDSALEQLDSRHKYGVYNH
jgi:hypothetical protein